MILTRAEGMGWVLSGDGIPKKCWKCGEDIGLPFFFDKFINVGYCKKCERKVYVKAELYNIVKIGFKEQAKTDTGKG